jgi:hypothetical protein
MPERNSFSVLLILSGLFLSLRPPPDVVAPLIGGARGPGEKLYVLTSEKGGLFVSGNGGRRWKNLGGSLPSSISFPWRYPLKAPSFSPLSTSFLRHLTAEFPGSP